MRSYVGRIQVEKKKNDRRLRNCFTTLGAKLEEWLFQNFEDILMINY